MDKYINLVLSALQEIAEDTDNELLKNCSSKTKLFGSNGVLDSMGIVFLVSEIEDLISDEFDVDVTLADEKAMSQITSPFRSVETLAKYIKTLIEE